MSWAGGHDGFEEPPERLDDQPVEAADAQEVASAAAKDVEALAQAPAAVLEAKAAIEAQLDQQLSPEPRAFGLEEVGGASNIQGVAVGGGDEISSLAAGAEP